jgi:hypothetical protein
MQLRLAQLGGVDLQGHLSKFNPHAAEQGIFTQDWELRYFVLSGTWVPVCVDSLAGLPGLTVHSQSAAPLAANQGPALCDSDRHMDFLHASAKAG